MFDDINSPERLPIRQGSLDYEKEHPERSATEDYAFQADLPGFWETAQASFLRNQLEVNLLKPAAGRYTGPVDPSFRPYHFLETNKDSYQDLYQTAFERNLLDGVVSEDHFYERIAAIRQEKKLLDAEMNGSWMAGLLGAGAAAVVDPTSYVGVGLVGKAPTVAGLVGRAAAQGAVSSAIQEAGLYSSQNLRTKEEMLMNTAANMMFSGGLTAFSHAMLRDHPANPYSGRLVNEEREFHPVYQKDGETIRVQPDDSVGRGFEGDDSVGAQRVEKEDVSGQEKLFNVPGLNWFRGLTPRARTLNWGSDVGQGVMQRLIDMTGRITKENVAGFRQLPNAETLRDYYFNVHCEQNFERGDRLIRQAMREMDRDGLTPVTPEDFHTVTRKILGPGIEEADQRALIERYGQDGADRVIGLAGQMASIWKKSADDFLTLARSKGVQIPDNIKDGEYWYPQIWKRDTILRDRPAVREALVRWLSKDPTMASEFHDWVHESYGVRADEFKVLEGGKTVKVKRTVREEDPAHPGDSNYWVERPITEDIDGGDLKKEILEAWAGEHREVELARLNDSLRAAKDQHRDASIDLKNTLRQMGINERLIQKLSLSQARKFRDLYHTRMNEALVARDRLTTEQRALATAAQAARQQALDRLLAGGGGDDVQAVMKRLFGDDLSSVQPTSTGSNKGKRKAHPYDPKILARLEGRMKEIERELAGLDRRHAKATERLQRADDLLRAVEERRARVTDLQAQLKDRKSALAQIRKDSAKDVGKLERSIKAKEGRPSLSDIVDDILAKLTDSGRMPSASLDLFGVNKEITGSRLKERHLILSREARLEAEQQGWLSTNLSEMMEQRSRQMASATALHEAFDLREGGGRYGFEKWQDVVDKVSKDYQDKIDAAEPKGKERWIKERDKFMEDLELIRNRLMYVGNLGLDNNSLLAFLTRSKRNAEYLRFGDGMGFANLMDSSTLVLRNRITDMIPHLREAIVGFKEMPDYMINALINSHEMSKSAAYSIMHRSGDDDALGHLGFGYGRTREWSGKLERAMNVGVDGVSKLSCLAYLNRFSKRLAGLTGLHEIREKVASYDKLSDVDRANLANLGIGRAEASKIYSMIQRFGETVDGHFDPHLEKWHTAPGGESAARDYYMALDRHMKNSVVTLGIGDLPEMATTWWGRLYFQFMTFQFAQMDRFFNHAAQRMYITKGTDFRTMLAMNTLLFWTGVVVAGKDYLRGEDPMKRYQSDHIAKTTHELADRAGVFGPFSQFVQVAARLAGFEGASRYERQNAWEPLLGMSASLPSDLGKAISTISDPNSTPEQEYKRLMILAPLQTGRKIAERIFGG